jgi:hypothetical protein
LLFVCAASIALLPTVCSADPILAPATTFIGLVAGAPGSSCAPSTGEAFCSNVPLPSGQSLSYSSGGVTASLTAADSYGSDPSTSASLTLTGALAPSEEFLAEALVDYQFEVVGPAGTAPISILSSGSSSISSPGTDAVMFDGAGTIWVRNSSGTIVSEYASCSGSVYVGCVPAPFTYDMKFSVTTGEVYSIEILSDIYVDSVDGDSTSMTYTGSGSLDPTVSLATTDPSYTLDLSPPPVPEPNYLALTTPCVAFGLMYAELRRRRLNLPTS